MGFEYVQWKIRRNTTDDVAKGYDINWSAQNWQVKTGGFFDRVITVSSITRLKRETPKQFCPRFF